MKRTLLASLLMIALTACSPSQDKTATTASLELPPGAACALDGMILADYPGPKGQIHYADGQVDYFCDTTEVLHALLEPEQARSVTGAYVQDMAQADWQKPEGHWIDAETAFYVIGSKMNGSMGPTLASFASKAGADAFAAAQGGTVHAYADITPQLVKLDGGVMHDHKM